MSCMTNGTMTVCGGGGWETIVDKPNGEPRWCFHCRKVQNFRYIVIHDGNPWYEPNPSIVCDACKADDGDMGFGRFRVWGEQ